MNLFDRAAALLLIQQLRDEERRIRDEIHRLTDTMESAMEPTVHPDHLAPGSPGEAQAD